MAGEVCAATITLSGILYSDAGVTPLSGQTVRLLIDGASEGTDITDASGNYSITTTVVTGDAYIPLLVFVDGGSVVGTTVTVMDSTSTTIINDLHIFADHLILRQDEGGTPLDNGDISNADGYYSNAGILYSVGGSDLSVLGANTKLYIASGHEYRPMGNVTTPHMQIEGTLYAETYTFTVSGDWDHSNGTFSYGTSTVDFSGTGTISITGAWWTKPFYNVNAAAAGQTTTILAGQGIGVTNVLSLGTGTLAGGNVNLSLNSGTPLVTAGAAITNSQIKFHPNSGGPINVAGTAYSEIWLAGNAATNTFTLTGDMSCTTLRLYGSGTDDNAIFDTSTSNYAVTCDELIIGSSTLDRYGTFRLNNSTVNIAGNVTINGPGASGTNEIDAAGSTINVGGDWTNNDTFTYGTSTVNFTGSGTISIDAASWTSVNKHFYNVSAAAAGQTTTVLATSGMVMENVFTLGTGTLAGGKIYLNKDGGTPLVTAGATLSNSLFRYQPSAGAVDVASTSYPDLSFSSKGAAITFSLLGNITCGKLQISGNSANKISILDTTTANYSISCNQMQIGNTTDTRYGKLVLNNSVVSVTGSVTIYPSDAGGTNEIDAGGATINVGGDWFNSDTFTYGTSTVNFTGTSAIDISDTPLSWYDNSKRFYDVTAAAGGQTTNAVRGMSIANVLTLGTGTVTGGELLLTKDGGTPLITSGATLSNYSVKYSPQTNPVNVASTSYPILWVSSSGPSITFTLLGDVSCDKLWLIGNYGKESVLDTANHSITCNQLNVGYASYPSRYGKLVLNNSTIDIGDLIIHPSDSGGVNQIEAGNGSLYVSGNWTNSDTFIAGSSSVILDGVNQVLDGSTTFFNLNKTVTAADTLYFTAGTTQTVTGNAILQGVSGQLLSLRSTASPTSWNFSLAAGAVKSISYVDVQDSDASGSDSSLIDINPSYSVDSGNNVSWFGNANITVVKSSAVISDPLNGTTNPKRIPGAVIEYSIVVTNTVGAQATNLTVTDSLTAESARLSFETDGYAVGKGIQVTAPNINGGAALNLTNVSDGDAGDYGATAVDMVTVGGIVLSAGDQATIKFRVVVQ